MGFSDGGISAATGFQTRNLEKEFLKNELCNIIINKSDKSIEFVQSGLRSATDILKKGGHLIQKYSDRRYSLEYDNKRCIINNDDSMLDSKP